MLFNSAISRAKNTYLDLFEKGSGISGPSLHFVYLYSLCKTATQK